MVGGLLMPATRLTTIRLEPYVYSLPMCTLMVALLARNLRRPTSHKTAVALVGVAFVLRWTSELFTYGVARLFFSDALPTIALLDTTVVTVAIDLLLTLAVLRSQLFSVRGSAATMVALMGSAGGVLGLAGCAIEVALRFATGPESLRAMLLIAALIPVAAVGAILRLRGRIEEALDPRRTLREAVLERAQASRDADPGVMLRTVREALIGIGGSPNVEYLRATGTFPAGAELPADLAARLRLSPTLLRLHEPGLPYDLVVAVRSHETLHGAIALSGGRIDRDTLLTATTLADRLALKLDAYALFVELEAARRLATLGSFAAAIAHDIRTPLTSVKMNVQILRSKAKSSSIDPHEDLEHFDIALEELDRLNREISELLDFAKPARVESAPVELRSLVLEVARAVEPALAAKKLTLETTSDELPPAHGDAQRLRQVLENLTTNAAAASSERGRITIHTRRAEDGRIAIEISDEGHGIAAKDLPHIFEPFFTTRPDGTGLGLAICDKLVRAHSGEIRVETNVPRGTTFTVFLPADAGAVRNDPLPEAIGA
jgi:signal transduction histidine kinase